MDNYNVYIISLQDENDVTLIGENLSEDKAEKRVMTGLMRCDRDNYIVGDYIVGSDMDMKYLAIVNKK